LFLSIFASTAFCNPKHNPHTFADVRKRICCETLSDAPSTSLGRRLNPLTNSLRHSFSFSIGGLKDRVEVKCGPPTPPLSHGLRLPVIFFGVIVSLPVSWPRENVAAFVALRSRTDDLTRGRLCSSFFTLPSCVWLPRGELLFDAGGGEGRPCEDGVLLAVDFAGGIGSASCPSFTVLLVLFSPVFLCFYFKLIRICLSGR